MDLDNLKPHWKNYKRISNSYSRLNEEDILGIVSSCEKNFSIPFSSRLLMNFCISTLMVLCCTGC